MIWSLSGNKLSTLSDLSGLEGGPFTGLGLMKGGFAATNGKQVYVFRSGMREERN